MDLILGWTGRTFVGRRWGPKDGVVHAVRDGVDTTWEPTRSLCGLRVWVFSRGDWPPRAHQPCTECVRLAGPMH